MGGPGADVEGVKRLGYRSVLGDEEGGVPGWRVHYILEPALNIGEDECQLEKS